MNTTGAASPRLRTARRTAWITTMVLAGALCGCASRTVPPQPVADAKPVPESRSPTDTVSTEVRSVLETQVKQWNEGNIPAFMEAYARSDTTRFASAGEFVLGWDTVLARYKARYATPEAMGLLSFSDIDITPLGNDAALVFGRWQLDRVGDQPTGLFTLLFRKTPEGWRIVHDHTSAAP